jgi:hypothetical protein
MKIENITEMTAGATGSGSVASVAQPVGKMQKRAGSLFKGKTTKKPFYEQDAAISSISQGVSEATLSEEDFILMPGQGHKLKPGLISKRPDHEVEMARGDLYQSAKNAKQICDMLSNVSEMQGLDGWVQAKITKASDYLNSVRQYLEGRQQAVSETEKPSAREKFNKGLKKAGYDPEKGADRLFSLLKKQAEEREKFEKAMPAVYGDKEGVAEGISDRPDAHISLLFYKKVNDVEYRLTKQGDDYKVFVGRKRQKYPDFESARAGLYQHLLNAQGVAESALDEACWKDYRQLGTKQKNGKTVPNCVPKKK